MNIRQRLEIRALVNLLISIIERLTNIFSKLMLNKNKIDTPDKVVPVKPNRVRPIKKIVDTIDNIIPLPWKK
jgi:hypothetical protein